MLHAKNLVKSFGRTTVVKDVSIEIGEQEVVGLLGSNGAGKSTTFKMIMGTLRPDSGHVEFCGQDISHLPMYKRCRLGIGYLAQKTSVFHDLSVEDNLNAVFEQLNLSRAERKRRCDELLESYTLAHRRKIKANRISGGEKRRLEMARALIMEPKLILLDEPFAGVDPIKTAEITKLIRQTMERGISVLITDHDVRSTLKTTDRAYVMHEGSIGASGRPEEIASSEWCRVKYLGHDFQLNLSPDSPSIQSTPTEENADSSATQGAE